MAAATRLHTQALTAAASHAGGTIHPAAPRPGVFVATFDRPADAVAAVLCASAELDVGARYALDTSTALQPDASIARCVRMCAVVGGGGIVLSRAAHDLVADRLPEDVVLVDLGVRRLPDLGRPEHLYGLSHPGRPPKAGSVRSLDEHPNNLPHDLTSFVGREHELTELREALEAARIVTATGAGGCGKTRLALQAAADALDRFPDGIWRVELAPLRSAAQVDQALAEALSVRSIAGESPRAAAARRLRSGRSLVLLDNCEHLVDAAAELTSALIRDCPAVTVLVTSRVPLRLPGEQTWRTPPLADRDAVRLFVERAHAAEPGFRLGDGQEPVLAGLCAALDRMPLAIELAAARVRSMSVEQIAAGLSERFQVLTGGPRTAPPRHRTLRSSIDWSYDLLAESERIVLRRLAVFAGRFDIQAAAAVALDESDTPALDLLAALVDQSLLIAEPQGTEVRFRLLESVREYALERLDEAGEADAARDRHLDHFLGLAERLAPAVLAVLATPELTRLEADMPNFAASLDWALETDAERAHRLCAALGPLWKTRGLFAAGEDACARTLEAGSASPPLRARVLWGRGYLLAFAGRGAEAIPVLESACAAADAAGDAMTVARSFGVLGMIRHNFDPAGARPIERRARDLAAAAGDEWCRVAATHALAWSYLVTDDYDEADRLFAAALPGAEALGYGEGLAWIYAGMSYRHMTGANAARLTELAGQAIRIARSVGEPVTEGVAHWHLARLELAQGRVDDALARITASRDRLIAGGAGMALPQTDVVLGAIRATRGELDEARTILARVAESGVDFGWNLAWALLQQADVSRVAGDATAAEAQARAALEVAGRVRSPMSTAWAKEILGRLAASGGDLRQGEALLHAALATRAERGLRLWLPQSLEALGEVAAAQRSYAKAARLLGAAASARSSLGLARWAPDAPAVEAVEAGLREALGEDAFAAAWREGERLAPEEAVAWVRRGRGERRRPARGWESLTPAEREVARRAAAGLTTREIAGEMFVTPGTVKTHLSHVYAKLGVRNRAELASASAQRAESL